MTADQLLAVIAFVGMAVSMLALGVRIGRRRALSQHRCPPRFTTEQLFAMQAREWEHRAGIDIKRHLGGSR